MSGASGQPIAAAQALAVMHTQGCDFLRVQGNLELQKFLDKTATHQGVRVSRVEFSDAVLKVNKRDKAQKRDLIITTTHVYIFKEAGYKSCQRETHITQIRAVVLAKGQPDEMLLQVRGSYDYRLLVVKRADAMRILCDLYALLTGISLPVETVDDLSAVQVLKADVKGVEGAEDVAATQPGGVATGGGAAANPPTGRFSFGSGIAPGVAAALESQKPQLEGWLSKKGHVNGVWRRRYFRLVGPCLLYYEARLKGTIELEHEGEVRVWTNKRIGGSGASSAHASNQAGDSSELSLAPLLYEHKIAGYNIAPERHMRDILADEERAASFVAFCETVKPLRSASSVGAAADAGQQQQQQQEQADESGDPKFWLAVDKFKTMWPVAAALSASAGVRRATQCASSPLPLTQAELLLAEAKRIVAIHVASDAPLPIHAPTPVRDAVGDILARKDVLSNGRVQQKGAPSTSLAPPTTGSSPPTTAAAPAPPSSAFTADLFHGCQHFVLERMTSVLLPAYVAHSRTSSAALVRDFQLKSALSDSDKKQPACSNCLASFGLLKRRGFCQYCGDVLCSSCLSNTCHLPAEYQVSESIKVCDQCAGVLEISDAHPHAFSYATKERARPIHLAASSPQEMREWVQALRRSIDTRAAKAAASQSAQPHQQVHQSGAAPLHREGWLMKEDPSTKVWRRRYCILDVASGQLYYYELNLKGSLSLTEGAGVHSSPVKATLSREDSQFGGVPSRSGFANRFIISYHSRLYALAADSLEAMESWMAAIQRVSRRIKPVATGGGGGLNSLLQQREQLLSLNAAAAVVPVMSPIASPSSSPLAGAVSGVHPAADYASSFAQCAPEGDVALVFTDVQNSTKLWEHASDAMNVALERHDAVMRMLLTIFNGYEVKTEGDAFFVAFFTALDAVRWCLSVQQTLLEQEWPSALLAQPSGAQETRDGALLFSGLRIRMGIHVGQPACRRNPITGRMDYFGPCVNLSARVSDSAHGGQVVCSREVADRIAAGLQAGEFPNERSAPRVSDLGTHCYKGISGPVQVYQVFNNALQGRNPFPTLRTTKADPSPQPSRTHAATDEEATSGAAAAASAYPSTTTRDSASSISTIASPAAISDFSVGVVDSASASVADLTLRIPDANEDEDDPPPPADEPPLPPNEENAAIAAAAAAAIAAAATAATVAPVSAGAGVLLSPSRPSHLSVPSLSAVPSIQPFTPSGHEQPEEAEATEVERRASIDDAEAAELAETERAESSDDEPSAARHAAPATDAAAAVSDSDDEPAPPPPPLPPAAEASVACDAQ